jgi:hypothetical protein
VVCGAHVPSPRTDQRQPQAYVTYPLTRDPYTGVRLDDERVGALAFAATERALRRRRGAMLRE